MSVLYTGSCLEHREGDPWLTYNVESGYGRGNHDIATVLNWEVAFFTRPDIREQRKRTELESRLLFQHRCSKPAFLRP